MNKRREMTAEEIKTISSRLVAECIARDNEQPAIMDEEIQQECMEDRTFGQIVLVDGTRIALLDQAGHCLFVCPIGQLPQMSADDLNF